MIFLKSSQVSGERLLNMSTGTQLCKKLSHYTNYTSAKVPFRSTWWYKAFYIHHSWGVAPAHSPLRELLLPTHPQGEIWPSGLYHMTLPCWHSLDRNGAYQNLSPGIWNYERGKSVSHSGSWSQQMHTQELQCRQTDHMLSSRGAKTQLDRERRRRQWRRRRRRRGRRGKGGERRRRRKEEELEERGGGERGKREEKSRAKDQVGMWGWGGEGRGKRDTAWFPIASRFLFPVPQVQLHLLPPVVFSLKLVWVSSATQSVPALPIFLFEISPHFLPSSHRGKQPTLKHHVSSFNCFLLIILLESYERVSVGVCYFSKWGKFEIINLCSHFSLEFGTLGPLY